MKKSILVVYTLLLLVVTGNVNAGPWEVLHEIAFIEKGGIDAIRIDFTIPVHYVSHAPAKHGDHVTVKIRFDRNEVPDTSDLPLMQSLYAPEGYKGPLIDVIYQTENKEPQLQLNFKHDVNFSVSQVMGITSLIVFLPDSAPKIAAEQPQITPIASEPSPAPTVAEPAAAPEPAVAPAPQVEAPVAPVVDPAAGTADSKTDIEAKKLFDDGRRALRTGKYNTAIQDFTAILSMPANKYSQSALEYLGIARERNNQNAHAKAIYDQYLKQFPEGEGAVRVRQRLAELLANQLKPRKKLEESPREKRDGKKTVTSELIGNLSQDIFYSDTTTSSAGRTVNYTTVDTLLSLNWRVRTKDWEFNNYYFGNYDYDTDTGKSDGLETTSAFSKIKNRAAGFYATLGRQLGSTTGVLGRFDGVYLGYDILPKVRINGVWGYPVDVFNKRTIQTNKPMVGVGMDFSGFLKGWDASPYFIQQQVDGIVDRKAVGAEIRYFEEKFNMFGIVDYDVAFNDINIFTAQGQYFYTKPTAITFNVDYRANPMLETSSALSQLGADVSIKDLLEGTKTNTAYSESQLQHIAADRTGHVSIVTLSVSHVINPKHQLSVDVSRSELSTKLVDTTDPAIEKILAASSSTDKVTQWDTSAQLVSNKVFNDRDSLINSLRYMYSTPLFETSYSVTYRAPYNLAFIAEPRISLRYRKADTGEILFRTIPGLRVNYRSSQNLRLYLEANLEIGSFSGNTNQENYRYGFYYFGYNWTF